METSFHHPLILLAVAVSLAGCQAPTVNLATSEPITVDINMRLDVYQYNTSNGQKPTAAQAAANPESRRRNRMADVQKFKNERLVGENHQGLVTIITQPEGDYGKYVATAVAEENADRLEIMKALATEQKSSLEDIQAKSAELWRNRSFKDEWIEEAQPDGSWKWVQKKG